MHDNKLNLKLEVHPLQIKIIKKDLIKKNCFDIFLDKKDMFV